MDRLKAKRAARRAQATKISTEATALIESGCSDRLTLWNLLDKLMASREELSKTDAQPFHGDLCSWMSFWEQFNGAVHTNRALTATDKFHYLRNYLSGEAAAAIAGLPTMEARYESAVQLLKDRFGDKNRIIQRHFRNLRELRRVTSHSEDKELRRLYDCVTLNVRCLNVLDVSTSSFSEMLYDVLLEALPKEIFLAFHRH
ncbi:uncharacterized protein LOC144175730 [Haemaphysalis longicornis]